MTTRLAIFDFDGTLADTWPWFVDLLDELAVRFRFRRIAAADADRMRGLNSRELMRELGIPWWRLPRIVRYARKRATEQIAGISLFAGAAEMLHESAAAGHTLAIVSSNSEANVRYVLGPATAATIAHYACGASLFGKAKKFREVLRHSGRPATDVISIGDEVRDIDAAREVGIAAGAVLWGWAHPDALRRAEPAHVFETMDALRGFLCTPNRRAG